MKTNNIKPNYSELARLHSCDRRTVKKYNNGCESKPPTRDKESKLDKYKEKIKSKLEEIKENIDQYIDLINNKKKDVVDVFYELTNLEIELRNKKAIYGCIRTAGFPFLKTFDDFDFSFQPSINKEQIIDFKNLRFIENKENIIFVGSLGVGKTHLATAIGITAAQNRNSTYFINCNDLIANLKKANSK